MRALLALLAAIAAAAIALLLLNTSTSTGDGAGARSASAEEPGPRAPVVPVASSDGTEPGRETADGVRAAGDPDAVGPTLDDSCVVTGRVVDTDRVPIEGALAQLVAARAWNEDVPGSPIATVAGRSRDGLRGFEQRTDAAGVFRFEVPEPVGSTALHVAADRFHERFRVSFTDRALVGERAALRAGVHDLGDIILARTGSVFGRVVTDQGTPVEGALMGLGPTATSTVGQYADSDANGEYRIAHAPAGTYGVTASLDGFSIAFVEGVEVRLGADVGPVDVVLERAETITGTVVDTSHAPVAGAKVEGWPRESGFSFRVETDESGRFVAALPSPGQYSIQVTHEDHPSWGDGFGRGPYHEPGTEDLLITLEDATKVRFRVVAAETGEPIERFGIRIHEGDGSKSFNGGSNGRSLARLEDHEGGVCELTAIEREDAVLAWAEGRMHVDTDVVLDEDGEGTMTISLERGAAVTGRLVLDGEGVPETPVEVVLVSDSGYERDLYRRTSRTDATGRFRVEGITARANRFRAHVVGRPPVVVDGLEFNPPETLDLGDVEVVDGGSVEGIVHVPSGIDPAGLTVRVMKSKQLMSARTDSSGRFEFASLAPGEHELRSFGRAGELAHPLPVTCTIKDGETTMVEIDATDCALVPVELTILIDGEPAEGASAFLRAVEGRDRMSIAEQRHFGASLGRIGEDGVVTGEARAFGEATLRLGHPVLGGIGHPTARLVFRPGQPVKETIRFELAAAELRLPAPPVLPDEGTMTVWLRGTEDGRDTQYLRLFVEDGALAPSEYASLDGAVLTLRGLATGPRTIEVTASEKDAPQASVKLPDGTTRVGPEELWSHSGSATLVAGETAEVTLD